MIKNGLLIVLLFLLMSCEDQKKKAKNDKLNIIIFLADDLGYGDLGSYGHPYIKTPNLDKLASSGLKLNRCYAASPVCSPSRVGLLTGKNPNRLGVYDWIPENSNMHIPDSVLTLPRMLKEKGYNTGLFGKWHCNGKFNSSAQPQPDDLGFDYWISTQNNASPSHQNPENFVRNGDPIGEINGFSAQIMADEVIDWLEGQSGEKPFFAYVPFHEPHEPIASPTHLVSQYENVAINNDQAQYFANVTNMDHAIGQIIQHLDQMGEMEHTLIVFTSDNGPETLGRYPGTSRSYGSSGSLKGMKVQLFEGGVRVPGIISKPGLITEGRESNEIFSSLDIIPTVASLLEIDLPKAEILDGVDMVHLLKGEEVAHPRSLFWFYPTAVYGPNITLISGEHKIMARSKHQYMDPVNRVGILINNETIEAIKKDSVSDKFYFYDLEVYKSEQQNLAYNASPLLDSLKKQLKSEFYLLRKHSPDIDLGL